MTSESSFWTSESWRPHGSGHGDDGMRSEELRLLLSITDGFSAGSDVNEILDTLYEGFDRILPFDRMEYAVADDDGYTLTTAWVRSTYDTRSLPVGFRHVRSEPISSNPKYRIPFLDNDLMAYARNRPDDHPVSLLVEEGVRSSLSCPLVFGEEVRGYIFFNSKRCEAYSEHHSALIQLVAGQLALILEQSRLNDELRSRNDELQKLEQSRLEFIASISHELRTPLTAVVGYASELEDRVDRFTEEEVSEFASVIASQSVEITGLVEDLLVITRAEAGHLVVDPSPVAVAVECRHVIESMPHERTEQQISYELMDLMAWADSLRVRQIARNFLANAYRYGGPSIRVRVHPIDDNIVLSVADDGHGIPAGDRELVFQAYERSHVSVGKPGSIGLGLTVSRHLAEAMNGTLNYDRVDGETRFDLRLPAYRHGRNPAHRSTAQR